MRHAIIVIERNIPILNYIRAILTDGDYDVDVFQTPSEALEYLRLRPRPHIALLAGELTGVNTPDLVRHVRRLAPHMKIVSISYLDQHQELVDAFAAGVREILAKPFLPADLLQMISRLTEEQEHDIADTGVEKRVGERMSMVYASPAMRDIEQQAALIARVSLPVLILGESGTGKEIVARYIHNLSPRANSTFLKVNCAAVPSELLESELFGYESGAFTGAARSKPGKFKLCHQGTMFLDEIGELHPALQAKLLQVLQDGSYSPLGSRSSEKVDVRIIAATNIDMKAAIAKRTFREDLYYRLNGFCVKLPPLRDRREDIPVLLRHFMARYAREMGLLDSAPPLSNRLLKACIRHDWPGNTRELESFVKRFLVLGDELLMLDELAQEVPALPSTPLVTPHSILHALHTAGGNRRAAALNLGISYKVLLHRLREFGIEPKPETIEA